MWCCYLYIVLYYIIYIYLYIYTFPHFLKVEPTRTDVYPELMIRHEQLGYNRSQ